MPQGPQSDNGLEIMKGAAAGAGLMTATLTALCAIDVCFTGGMVTMMIGCGALIGGGLAADDSK
jgi:hypothetical protein